MNKKLIFIIALVLLVIWLTRNLRLSKEVEIEEKPTPSPLLQVINFPQINFKSKDYSYSLIKVSSIAGLKLVENKDKEKGKDLIKKYQCQEAINAGFYDKDNRVIGLFLTDGLVRSSAIESKLFDGLFFVNQKNQVTISRRNLGINFKIGLQSGPMLYINSQPITLIIQDDKPARRMIAFLDKNNQLYFLTVFDKEFRYQGPNLVDLPLILKKIAQQEKMEVKDALNLDGGSASFFHSLEATLDEYNPIGSLFCIR